MALDIYSNNYTHWVHPNNEYSRELRLQKRFANVSGKSSDQMAVVQKKAELETLLRTPPVNAATKERLLREIGELIDAKKAKNNAELEARLRRITGPRVPPPTPVTNAVLKSHANAMTNAQKKEAIRTLQIRRNAVDALYEQKRAIGREHAVKIHTLLALFPTFSRSDIVHVLANADNNLEIAKKRLREKFLENKEKTGGLTNREREELHNPFGVGPHTLSTSSALYPLPPGSESAVPPAGGAGSAVPLATVTIPAGGAGAASTAYVGNSATTGVLFKPDLSKTPSYLLENPEWQKEAARLQAKAKAERELAEAIARIPTGVVKKGGRSRRLKSKRNKRTRRHVR